MKKVLIAVGVVLVIGVFVVINLKKEGSRTSVEVTKVTRRTITKYVTASGRIKAKREVNVSASAIGKITRLAVKEGDRVEKGDFLLEIDPTQYQSAVDQLSASIRAARAKADMEAANLRKAEYDYEKAGTLREQNVISEDELRNAKLSVDVAAARLRAAQEDLAQLQASLGKADHDLGEVRIEAEISGVITALNVEEGESAIMGTLNNPGTVLLTVSDLSEIETEVEVDETEVVLIEIGQEAVITVDAYPDTTFRGVVTEVGNSAMLQQVGMGQTSVDFKVVILLKDRIPNVRPGLSASAEIKVAHEENVLSVPIQCLTVRDRNEIGGAGGSADTTEVDDEAETSVEGVFVVEDGSVEYRPVRLGIAGSRYFEVISGLEENEIVVEGPFKAINDLSDGDRVKVSEGSDSS